MPFSRVTPPSFEPLTWAQAQKQLRLDGLEDDKEYVMSIVVPTARDRGELATRRAFVPQTWQYLLNRFPREGYIEIPKPPLISVSFLKYYDMAGTLQTWAASNYHVQAPAGDRCARGRIALPFASVWPIAQPRMGAVIVEFQCGYAGGTTDNPSLGMPPSLVTAMLTDVARLYEHRESLVVDTRAVGLAVPGTAQDIYRSYRSVATQRVQE